MRERETKREGEGDTCIINFTLIKKGETAELSHYKKVMSVTIFSNCALNQRWHRDLIEMTVLNNIMRRKLAERKDGGFRGPAEFKQIA